MADEYIAKGKIDFIGMGRAQLADPNFANKAKEGRVDDIVRCIGCSQGRYDKCTAGEPITCLRNPELGKEKEFAQLKTPVSKKVLVIGGGMGG